jgi:tripartite-type tricarboxylate transporter receptor subunit TctC
MGATMNLPRRTFLHLAAVAATLPSLPRIASAADYPTRPVRIIVGFPAGGSATDIAARLISQSLSERLGQQFIVDNRPGAGSNLAAESVVRAPPDGYTLLAMTVTNAVNATLYQGLLSFDIVRDIAPIAATFRSPNVLILTPSIAIKTLAEFIAFAKANPGKINYASGGYGTTQHVNGELFKMMAGVELFHVPYRSNFIPDLVSGQIQMSFSPIPVAIGYIRTGQLRALAVTGATRSDALPDVPAVAELIPGFEAYVWHGIGGPKNTSVEIISKLNHEINAVLADPRIVKQFANLGGIPLGGSPADFGKLIADETEKWGKVVRFANIKPE